jgi:DNA-binding transcriptional MocR family regulator
MTDTAGSARIVRLEAAALPGTSTITVDNANLLGRDIVSGRFAQGETLPNEAEFSSSFAVGRSAVREAVKMLAAKGLVQSRPRRGTQVLPAKSWNFFDREVLSWLRDSGPQPGIIIELLELRLGVEPQAAALATIKVVQIRSGRCAPPTIPCALPRRVAQIPSKRIVRFIRLS